MTKKFTRFQDGIDEVEEQMVNLRKTAGNPDRPKEEITVEYEEPETFDESVELLQKARRRAFYTTSGILIAWVIWVLIA